MTSENSVTPDRRPYMAVLSEFGCAMLLGLAPGILVGGYFGLLAATVDDALHGRALDGPPPPPRTTGERIALHARLVGGGAALGGAVGAALGGVLAAAIFAIRAVFRVFIGSISRRRGQGGADQGL
jgi:hypothetical protein